MFFASSGKARSELMFRWHFQSWWWLKKHCKSTSGLVFHSSFVILSSIMAMINHHQSPLINGVYPLFLCFHHQHSDFLPPSEEPSGKTFVSAAHRLFFVLHVITGLLQPSASPWCSPCFWRERCLSMYTCSIHDHHDLKVPNHYNETIMHKVYMYILDMQNIQYV